MVEEIKLADDIKEYWLENYPEETPRKINYMMISLGEFLRNTAKNYPNAIDSGLMSRLHITPPYMVEVTRLD